MKKHILSKKIGKFFGGMVMAAMIAAISIPVYAMEDGAYTVGRTTSYVNPETGVTADGGTNIALGDSMCSSIVESTALVEQYQGKTYVTLGLGLMSNVSNVRIQIQGADGNYREVGITRTGSCSRDGDTCYHYRFEVDSVDNYISPILYVTPMGRDVQFFVKLDMGSMTAGTGNFVSEMIPAAEPAAQAAQTADQTVSEAATTVQSSSATSSTVQNTAEGEKSTETATEVLTDETEELIAETESVETESTEAVFEDATEDVEEETEEPSSEEKEPHRAGKKWMILTMIIVAVLAAAGGIGYVVVRKKRM